MPTETGSAAPSPLQSLLRRWPLALAAGLVLALLGFLLAGLLPSKTTAEARVAVGPGDMSAGAVAGFPEATRSMAEDYARWVTTTGVQQGGAATITASPVPESNVIRVEAEAGDAATATKAAQQTAESLVASVNKGRSESDPDQTLQNIRRLSSQWAAARTELSRAESAFGRATAGSGTARAETAGEALTKAQAAETTLSSQLEAQQEKYKRQVADATSSADLRIVSNAAVASDSAKAARQQYAILGFALGLLLTLVYAALKDRRSTRRHRES